MLPAVDPTAAMVAAPAATPPPPAATAPPPIAAKDAFAKAAPLNVLIAVPVVAVAPNAPVVPIAAAMVDAAAVATADAATAATPPVTTTAPTTSKVFPGFSVTYVAVLAAIDLIFDQGILILPNNCKGNSVRNRIVMYDIDVAKIKTAIQMWPIH
jgi:hypothetical protein